MALSINTNVASLNAQRNLQRSQETLNTSLQRLSTGLRINSAKDDAAGLAISTRFTTQINGLNQAVRNANDGISLAQTGEAALDEITNNLQRIRELAVQSANATNSTADRQALDAEVQQRLAEISRIGGQTSFNGTKILDGSFGNAAFQVGANVGETINVNLSTGVTAGQLTRADKTSTMAGGALTGVASTGFSISVGGVEAVAVAAPVDGTGSGYEAASAAAGKTAIDAASIVGLSVSTNAAELVDSDAFTDIVTGAATGDTYSLTINDVEIFNVDGSGGAVTITAAQMVAAINAQTADTGVTATIDADDVITLTGTEDGRSINVAEVTGGTVAGGFDTAPPAATHGTLTMVAYDTLALTGDFAALGLSASQDVDDANAVIALNTASVLSVEAANGTIKGIDAALTTVSALRSDFGAVQNRFESTITNLQTISENLSASRGRILDADFAAETANLTKAQILQQAGTAILAQANALPQAALSLLQ